MQETVEKSLKMKNNYFLFMTIQYIIITEKWFAVINI